MGYFMTSQRRDLNNNNGGRKDRPRKKHRRGVPSCTAQKTIDLGGGHGGWAVKNAGKDARVTRG